MPVYVNFPIVKREDGVVQIVLAPPADVRTWPVRFTLSKRFGGQPLFRKYNISGTVAGQSGAMLSGVAASDPARGAFDVEVRGIDTSGLEPGNYAFVFERMTSGAWTVLAQGYEILGVNSDA